MNIKHHCVAIFLAVIVGLISVAPQLYVLKDARYQGIQMFGTDAEPFYLAEMNQARYEDYSQGIFPPDPGKNYYLAPKLGARLIAGLSSIFRTRVIEINVWLKFFGPVLLLLILYGWLYEMFSSRLIALVGGLFVMLGINLLTLVDLVHLGLLKTSAGDFLPYTRPLSPLISSMLLFLGLWGIYRLVARKAGFNTALLIGVLAGISLYEYFYTWIF